MGKEEKKGIPFGPLLDRWLNLPKETKATFARKMGVPQANVTNWIARGIPPAKLPKAAKLVGLTADTYLMEQGLLEAPKGVSEPPPTYQVVDPDLERILKAWGFLSDEERKDLLADVMAKAGYNAVMKSEYGRLPDHAPDARVASAYKVGKKA